MGVAQGGGYGKEELLWGARAILEIMARRKPLIVIFDDIHWAEPILLDVIEHLAGGSEAAPLLVVCTARHELLEERPGFLESQNGADRIELRELARDDMKRLLANLLGDAWLPESLTERILAVAGGNPLFAEQMVCMLADSEAIRARDGQWEFAGGVEDDVSVPPNVSSLLAARLDRLQSAERGLVERAAVIGVDFETAALSALAPDGDAATDLAPPLAALCGKHIIRPSGVGQFSGGYQFANLLLRDAAYDRLLKRARARMHERFAGWLIEASGNRLAEREEIIGYHLEQSFRYRAELGPVDEEGRSLGDRAAGHLGAAGSRAFDRGDMHAAASLLQRAAGLLEAGHADRPWLLVAAGDALADLGELDVAEARLAEARRAAALTGDEAAARSAELAQLHLRFTTGATGAEVSVPGRVRELIGVLEAAGDDLGLARAWRLMTYVHGMASQFGNAAEAAERAISHAARAGNEVMARRSSGLLVISALSGSTPVSEAAKLCEANLAHAADDRKALAITEAALAHLAAMRGNFEQARTGYKRSRGLLEEYGYRLFAALTSMDSAPVEMLAGDLEAAERELRGDYGTLEQMGERAYLSSIAGLLAEVLYRQGRYGESGEFAAACEELASDDDVASQFLWRRVRAKLLARAGQHESAGALIGEANELIGATDWLDWQGDGFMDLAELHILGDRAGAALEALALASARFTAKGNVVSARRADALAGELLSAH